MRKKIYEKEFEKMLKVLKKHTSNSKYGIQQAQWLLLCGWNMAKKHHIVMILEIYPEIARCVSCNTCTKSCPQDIEVMKYIQRAVRGDI